MSKFKVGDRVITTVRPYCTNLERGQELMITRIYDYVGPTMGQLYEFDDTGNGVYEAEIELVPTLFRKGDKVLVEYTVTRDELPSRTATEHHISVTSPGHNGAEVSRLARILNAGTITRAPEPPYVPKVGDKFNFGYTSDPNRCETCIYTDDFGLLYENRWGERHWAKWSCDRNTNPRYFKR